MKQIVLASNNAGKLEELQNLLLDTPFTITPQSEFSVPEVEETGLSFVENAILKARHAAQHCGHPCIADDSGLVVDALQGAPGIYSARYAGANSSDKANYEKLLAELHDKPLDEWNARFICVMVYLAHHTDPTPLISHGQWEGRIQPHPQGDNGFGYDPVFYVPSHGCTSAELSPLVKNNLSHRSQAVLQLVEQMKTAEI